MLAGSLWRATSYPEVKPSRLAIYFSRRSLLAVMSKYCRLVTKGIGSIATSLITQFGLSVRRTRRRMTFQGRHFNRSVILMWPVVLDRQKHLEIGWRRRAGAHSSLEDQRIFRLYVITLLWFQRLGRRSAQPRLNTMAYRYEGHCIYFKAVFRSKKYRSSAVVAVVDCQSPS